MLEAYKNQIDFGRIPQHIAVIMDGNGRWATEKGQDRLFGHINGVESVKTITEACGELGVKYLTLYTFSKENWNRPQEEVSGLMSLLVSTITAQVEDLNKNNVKFGVIGDLEDMPKETKEHLKEGIHRLSENTGLQLFLALNYSSRWEIENAVKHIVQDVKDNRISSEEINQQLIEKYLCTKDIPDPELMIRTGGERRISNFLLYQLAYAELYFSDKLWPDFSKEDLYKSIIDFQQRERRFGKTSDQIKNN